MLAQFEKWITEIGCAAVDDKKQKALSKGTPEKWKNEIWLSPDKNKAIKNRFRDEGAHLGYKSRPSYVTEAREWLYDFVWRKMDEEGRLIRVELAMEIEVSACDLKSIRYDFNKLLQAEAKYKVLVFQQKTQDAVDLAFQYFEKSHGVYEKRTMSSYLLCGWCTGKNSFSFKELHD